MVSILFFLSSILLAFTNSDAREYADTYNLTSTQHKSAVFAMGCFWCGEEAFEHYAPGVIEAVSGYSGGPNPDPSYYNHPGHYEVVLVEYDPNRTSYEVLLRYYWRNIDPFDSEGQFCDKGSPYRPAIFYETEEEKAIANLVFQNEILNWDNATGSLFTEENIFVPVMPRPTFWKAEDYHQNYYITNAGNYYFYKNGCRRVERLKEVWGEETYNCYHNISSPCHDIITNMHGDLVASDINLKGVGEGKAALLPKKYWAFIMLGIVIFLLGLLCGRVSNRWKSPSGGTPRLNSIV